MLVGIAYEELNQANATLKRENEDLRSKIQELSGIIQLAYLDPLTGIHNRRYYEQRILEEINRAQRHPDQVFSLVLIDLNDFKVINDSFGHAKGDEVLRRFSAFLTSNIRAQDICCRFAGDEFVIILPSTVKEEAQQFTDRLRVELRKDNSTSEIPMDMSLGVASFGSDGKTMAQILDAADRRMYQEKRATKNRSRKIKGMKNHHRENYLFG